MDPSLLTESLAETDLVARACPAPEDVPFFNHYMTIARERGMTWEEGLRYTIEQRERSH